MMEIMTTKQIRQSWQDNIGIINLVDLNNRRWVAIEDVIKELIHLNGLILHDEPSICVHDIIEQLT